MTTNALLALATLVPPVDMVAEVKRIEAESSKKLLAAKAISGEYVGPISGEFVLQKPILFRAKDSIFENYFDGKVHWTHVLQEKQFIKGSLEERGFLGVPIGLGPFFGVETPNQLYYFINFTEHLFLKVGSKRAAAIVYHFESFGRDDKVSLFIDPATKLPVGWDQVFGGTKSTYRYRNLRFIDPAPPADFHWKIPKGVKERSVRKI